MAKVAVCEGIGRVLEPDDDSMKLAYGANQGMVDGKEHSQSGNQQTEGSVNAMSQSDVAPYRLKHFLLTVVVLEIVAGFIALPAPYCSFGLLYCSQFNDICGKQMTWNKRIENGAEDHILTSVVMTSDTYQHSVLELRLVSNQQKGWLSMPS